jgi:hypothetical protein
VQKVALVLSVAALAASGWLLWNASSAATEVERLRHDLDALAAMEARVAALEGVPSGSPPAPRPVAGLGAPPEPSSASGEGSTTPGTDAGTIGAGSRPATVPHRVADLEKRLAALEDRTAKEAAPPGIRPARRMTGPGGGRFYVDVEDAKQDLELTPQQAGDFDRVLEDAHRQVQDLHRVPDDEGKTWEQVQRETFSTTDGGAFRLDLSKLEAFRRKTVPGRSETYGQAEQRIRDEAKRRMRDTLTTAQQEKFDKASVDPLLGGGAAGTTFVSFGVVTESAPSADGK